MNQGERSAIFALLVPGMVLGAVAGLLLVGCDGGDALREQAQRDFGRAEAAVTRLGEELDAQRLPNAALIAQYARELARAKPSLREITTLLGKEGTRDGTLYQGLQTRLTDARGQLPDLGNESRAHLQFQEELANLAAAASGGEFNRALTDPLNVLADLSDGALPRVGAISKAASQRANGAEDLGAGSQLVGNPSYGQWRTDSGGNSFWVWYGQYSLMRNLLGGGIGYGAWSRGRDYSYYHDYGRRNYTSPSARQRQAQVESTARRKFSSQGRTFNSPYARQRQGASAAVSRQKFASSYAQSRSQPRASTASVRGYGSGGYRGPRRGK